MTNRELLEKYDCLLLAKGILLDAEANPELEESDYFDEMVKERVKNDG